MPAPMDVLPICCRFTYPCISYHGTCLWWRPPLQTHRGGHVYSLDTTASFDDVRMLTMTDTDGWIAFRYTWISPAHVQSLGLEGTKTVAMPETNIEGILACCARSAFGTLPLTFLRNLAAHVRLEMIGNPPLFDVLWKLIRHCLPSETEANLWSIMQLRWHSTTSWRKP